jgi:methionyl-tRNA formyltransferase
LRIVFMGSPEFAIVPLQFLVFSGHNIKAVYTRPDKPSGRGRAAAAPPIKAAALSWDLPLIQVPNFKSPEAVEQLVRLRPEAIVVAAFGQILPPPVLDIPCYGCLNIHPSLLPKYRGASPVAAAILAGDEFAGVSVMRLDEHMDTGPVFSRAQIPILPQDNAGSLTSKLFQVGARILLQVLADLPGGKWLPEPQNDVEASYTREITKQEGRINWALPASEIWKKVRAYQPWPEAYTYWQKKQLKIIEVLPLSADLSTEAGRVISLLPAQKHSGAGFGIGTGKGLLGIVKVQIEGKRAMNAEEFARGQRDFIGSLLGERETLNPDS